MKTVHDRSKNHRHCSRGCNSVSNGICRKITADRTEGLVTEYEWCAIEYVRSVDPDARPVFGTKLPECCTVKQIVFEPTRELLGTIYAAFICMRDTHWIKDA